MSARWLFFLAVLCILAGTVLLTTSAVQTPAGPPEPDRPAPTPGAPAWAHTCLGTDDEPPGCP